MDKPRSNQPLPSNAKKVFQGTIFSVYQWDQKMFDGSIQIFEKIRRDDTVSAIPVTLDGKIILCEQEQPGQEKFLSVAGGKMDEGEDVLTCVKRELLEETGYTTGELIEWFAVQPSTMIDWAVYVYIAKGCKKTENQHLDPGEKITLRFVEFTEFVDLVYDDIFRDTEITLKIMKAQKDPAEFEKIKKLLSG